MSASVPILRLRGIWKAFGATQALRGVDLEVLPGRVHAIIGENGAGKSTLMKILSGALRPDSGEMELLGERYAPAHPHAALKAGVAMVYQELTLAPHLSVRANLLLGMEPAVLGFTRPARERMQAWQALGRLGHAEIDIDAPVGRLPVAAQQVVEIARACLREVRLLILDEPTGSLGRADVARLFRFIGELKAAGVSILYISHFIEECQQVADRYTVLRDGAVVHTGPMAEASLDDLIRMMAGRELGALYPRREPAAGPVVLRLQALAGRPKPKDVSLEVRAGEILGIAGLIGSGRTELLRCIYGLDRRVAGLVAVDGRPVRRQRPAHALRCGLGLLSENRKEEGLLLRRSVTDNLLLGCLRRYTRAGLLSPRRMAERGRFWLQQLGVRASGPDAPVDSLSGGNQQKVALGRLLEQESAVLLLDEPTRGIDVRSKAQIYQLIADLAAQGKAVVLVSSHLPELLGMCDRIAVMHRGRITCCRPRADWTEESLLAAAIGGYAA